MYRKLQQNPDECRRCCRNRVRSQSNEEQLKQPRNSGLPCATSVSTNTASTVYYHYTHKSARSTNHSNTEHAQNTRKRKHTQNTLPTSHPSSHNPTPPPYSHRIPYIIILTIISYHRHANPPPQHKHTRPQTHRTHQRMTWPHTHTHNP
jgi:hypothetical protein